MISHLLWLQLTFLYLPMLVIGLAIYGADFEHPSGEVYQWTPAILVALHWLLRSFGQVFARRAVAAPVLIACAVAVALAYRPLHMEWWDERSTNQALRVLAMGVCSVLVSHIGALRVNETGGPRAAHSAGALAVLAVLATSGMLYPLMPLLALAPVMATGAVLVSEQVEGERRFRESAPFGGWHRFAAVLASMELSLPLWDFQTDPRWAASLGLGLAGICLGVLFTRRSPLAAVALPTLAVVAVFASAIASELLVSHARTLLVGGAAGWLLSPLFDAPAVRKQCARLGWLTPFWMLGLLLGFTLSANRAFLGLRVLLWLPFVFPLLHQLRTPRELRAPRH